MAQTGNGNGFHLVPVEHDPFDPTGGLAKTVAALVQGQRMLTQQIAAMRQELQQVGALGRAIMMLREELARMQPHQDLHTRLQDLTDATERLHAAQRAPRRIERDANGWPSRLVVDEGNGQ